MYTGAAHADFFGMGAGEGIDRLCDAADAGTAVHVLDTEGEARHGNWMQQADIGR